MAEHIEFGARGTCKNTLRAQHKGADTYSLAPEAPTKTLYKSRTKKLRNVLESLGNTNINNKFETLNPKSAFLSSVWGVCMIFTYIAFDTSASALNKTETTYFACNCDKQVS